MNNIFDKLSDWAIDRQINEVPFSQELVITNVVEELMEMAQIAPGDERPRAKVLARAMAGADTSYLTGDDLEYQEVDAMSDAIIYLINGLTQRGYYPEKVLWETYREINSRTGAIVDGKFEKDTSDEAKARWHKADYTDCKIHTNSED